MELPQAATPEQAAWLCATRIRLRSITFVEDETLREDPSAQELTAAAAFTTSLDMLAASTHTLEVAPPQPLMCMTFLQQPHVAVSPSHVRAAGNPVASCEMLSATTLKLTHLRLKYLACHAGDARAVCIQRSPACDNARAVQRAAQSRSDELSGAGARSGGP